jgi:hypothetical protein
MSQGSALFTSLSQKTTHLHPSLKFYSFWSRRVLSQKYPIVNNFNYWSHVIAMKREAEEDGSEMLESEKMKNPAEKLVKTEEARDDGDQKPAFLNSSSAR